MGKQAPTPPPAPNPVAIANAQGQANADTARLQSGLNNVNVFGPTGSAVFDQKSPDRWSETISLSPQEQATYDKSKYAQNAALDVAGQQVGRVGQALGQGLTPPGLQVMPGVGPISTGYDAGGPIQNSFNPGQGVQGSVSPTNVQYGYAGGGPIQSHVTPQSLQYGFDPGQGVQGSVAPGHVQSTFGDAGGIQGHVDQTPVQSTFGPTSAIQHQITGQDSTSLVNQAQDAAYRQATSRLDPQWQQSAEQQQAQLVAQGLNPNSAAFQNSMKIFNDAKNDAYNQANFSAIGAGNQEQNVLFGQDQARGQFTNSAQAQEFGQQQARGTFANQASDEAFAHNLQGGQFANQAQQQTYNQAQGRGEFANAAEAQDYGQRLSSGEFANSAAAQQFGQNQSQAAFHNATAGQDFSQGVTNADLANSAQAQQFGQNRQVQQDYNAAAAQDFGQHVQAGQFGNAAAAQEYAQNQGQAAFGNAAQAQGNAQNAAAAAFGNTAEQQHHGELLDNTNQFNAANTQGFQNNAYAQELPINELSALLSSGQVSMPSATPAQTPVAPTDVTGAYALSQQAAQSRYQAQMQNYQSGLGGLFSLGSAAMNLIPMSDVRVKRDVTRLAERPDGLGVYLFRYLGHDNWHIGAMAQEVARVRPDALVDDGGLLRVDYGRLAA